MVNKRIWLGILFFIVALFLKFLTVPDIVYAVTAEKVDIRLTHEDSLEDENNRAEAYCTVYWEEGGNNGCTPEVTSTSYPDKTVYKYTFSRDGKSDTEYETVWNFKEVGITDPKPVIYVDAVRGFDDPSPKCTKYYYGGYQRDCTSDMQKDGSIKKIGSDDVFCTCDGSGDGVRFAKFYYEYETEHTPKRTAEKYRVYYYVTKVDLNIDKDYLYVDRGKVIGDYNITCVKTFGDETTKRDCYDSDTDSDYSMSKIKDQTKMDKQSLTIEEYFYNYVRYAGYTSLFPDTGDVKSQVFTQSDIEDWEPGKGERVIKTTFGENYNGDSDTLKLIYVTDVDFNDGTGKSSDGKSKPVHVNETHEKGKYLGDPPAHLTDPYKEPTCTKTYSDGKTQDCTKDMEPVDYNYQDKWSLGKPERDQRYYYTENAHEGKWTIPFYYPTKIDIVVSDKNVYQDEPYGTYSCTKYYSSDGTKRSCMDKMYIESDSGQNSTMNGERKINYKYVNNGYQDTELQTRIYANSVKINAPATGGKTGFKGKYYADVIWQNNEKKDISLIKDVWRSEVCATKEEVKYLNDVWSYTDIKGDVHGNSAINEFYIPDPIAKKYCISAKYPLNGPFNNGLVPGYSYVEDKPAQKKDQVAFDLIGIEKSEWIDNTVYVHDVDKDSSGNKLKTTFPENTASAFSGSKNAPTFNVSPILAFNNKTYQTGHWYDFKMKVTWSDGSVEYLEDTSSYPEATWRYGDASGKFRFDYTDYPVGGTNGFFPYNSNDHRLLLEGWNPLRFDMFSEAGIRKPALQNNAQYQKTYTVAHAWAHSPTSIVISGPSIVESPKTTNNYQAYLNWKDGTGIKQNGQVVGANNNPWSENHGKRTEVTNSQWTIWKKEEQTLTTPSSGPLKVSFPEFSGNNFYRTLSVSWGDKHRTLPGFTYWDYFYSELDVRFYQDSTNPDGCADITVPTMNCPIPVDKTYRTPENDSISVPRTIEFGIKFNVTGISQGSGE